MGGSVMADGATYLLLGVNVMFHERCFFRNIKLDWVVVTSGANIVFHVFADMTVFVDCNPGADRIIIVCFANE